MVNVAWHCAEPDASDWLHSCVVPSKNVTLPVGVPSPPDTVAVRATDCPGTDGFGLDVRETFGSVLPLAVFTVWLNAPEDVSM